MLGNVSSAGFSFSWSGGALVAAVVPIPAGLLEEALHEIAVLELVLHREAVVGARLLE